MTINQAIKNRDEARTQMNAHKIGTKQWIDAEENLNFWQGKVAHLEAIGERTCSMTEKQRLATEYAILKRAVWTDEGVAPANNSKKAHYKNAMRFKTIPELIIQTNRLTEKLCSATQGKIN